MQIIAYQLEKQENTPLTSEPSRTIRIPDDCINSMKLRVVFYSFSSPSYIYMYIYIYIYIWAIPELSKQEGRLRIKNFQGY